MVFLMDANLVAPSPFSVNSEMRTIHLTGESTRKNTMSQHFEMRNSSITTPNSRIHFYKTESEFGLSLKNILFYNVQQDHNNTES